MRIRVLVIGKTVPSFMSDGVEEYWGRIRHYCNFECEVLTDVKRSPAVTADKLCEMESDAFLKRLKPTDFVVLLDERGVLQDSVKLAQSLGQWMNSGALNPVFIIGGAYGFGDGLRGRANALWSLSPLTFSHQLARLVFAEQLYRAFTIIRGEPYHHK
ncbi:MAG: 23S rRNA (pseudouridine(1915)-N(3))-methyltransferase RlmH [Bacteroidota bacterium]|jgi:23S rRNA (pseudouridine1915-N3)-methyltransferase